MLTVKLAEAATFVFMGNKMNYQAGIRAMIKAGDFTSFTDVLKIAPPSAMAKAAGMQLPKFRKILEEGFKFTPEEIEGMADHLEITQKVMKELIKKDRQQYLNLQNPDQE